jgi:hypothetical protein
LGVGLLRNNGGGQDPHSIVRPVKMMMIIMMFDWALAFVFNFKVKTYGAPTDVLNYAPRNEDVRGSGGRHIGQLHVPATLPLKKELPVPI